MFCVHRLCGGIAVGVFVFETCCSYGDCALGSCVCRVHVCGVCVLGLIAFCFSQHFMKTSKFSCSGKGGRRGGRLVARLKLKGIDGSAPPGVALFDTTREKLTRSRHSKDGQIDSSFLIGQWPLFVGGVVGLVHSVNEIIAS